MSTFSSSSQSAVVGIAAETGTFLQQRFESIEDTCVQAGKYAGKNPWERHDKDLFFTAVTFLAFLQVTIAAALASVHHSSVWQVEETLPASRGQVASQLFQVAVVKHTWKRVTGARWERGVNDTTLDSHLVWTSSKLYPVAAAMMQPPSSALAWQQPVLSWVIPKLWPISCAMVAATPTADSEWSCWTWRSKRAQKSAWNFFWAHIEIQDPWNILYFK